MQIAGQAEVFRIQNLVRVRVIQDRLGMNPRLVGESRIAGDVIVEGHVNAHNFSDEVLNLPQHREIVLCANDVGAMRVHARHQPAQRRNAVPFAYAEDSGIHMGGARGQGAIGVCDCAAGIVVAVKFDVAGNDTAQRPHQVMHLERVGNANCVRDAHSVHADLIYLAVHGEEVDKIAAE